MFKRAKEFNERPFDKVPTIIYFYASKFDRSGSSDLKLLISRLES